MTREMKDYNQVLDAHARSIAAHDVHRLRFAGRLEAAIIEIHAETVADLLRNIDSEKKKRLHLNQECKRLRALLKEHRIEL